MFLFECAFSSTRPEVSSAPNVSNHHCTLLTQDGQNLRENKESIIGQKRFQRASPQKEIPNAKRSALVDLTNNVGGKRNVTVKAVKHETITHRPMTRSMSGKKDKKKEEQEADQRSNTCLFC